MTFAIIGISLSWLLYTIAIWSEFFIKRIAVWMVTLFCIAFLSDVTSTFIMFLRATSKTLTYHAFAGYAALAIITLHLIWILIAHKKPKAQKYFHKYSLVAWGIWQFAFFSGIPQ